MDPITFLLIITAVLFVLGVTGLAVGFFVKKKLNDPE